MTSVTTTGRVAHACVTDQVLDVSEHLDAVRGPRHRAADVFIGTIRDHDPEANGTVTRLEYEAHPDAEGELRALAARVAQATGATIAVSHRRGELGVGDVAVVIASGAAHRAHALEATRSLIELVKTEVPIWKSQTDESGNAGWVGL